LSEWCIKVRRLTVFDPHNDFCWGRGEGGEGTRPGRCLELFSSRRKKNDWETLVPRINVENGIKLGFLLE
jgi:hypothetical protein